MPEDIMEPPVVDNSQADASIADAANPPVTPEVLPDSSPDTDVELSLDDSPEQLDEKLIKLDKPDAKTTKPIVPVAKPKETSQDKKTTDKGEDKSLDEAFDLGEEEKEEVKEEPVKGKRDYSDVSEEQKEILKHIPNYLLGKVKSFLKETDKLKSDHEALKVEFDKVKTGKLPEFYFDHEKAYLLHPDFDQTQQLSNQIDFEEAHYEQQLAAIENGQSWWELTGYKNGQPQFSEHKALGNGRVDIQGRILAHKNLAIYANKRNEVQQKLGEITSSFKQQHETTKQNLQAIDDKFFSKLRDITKLPKQAQDYYNQAKDYLETTIPAFKGHKVVDFLAKSALSNIYKTQEITKLRNENKLLKEKKSDQVKAGPTSKDLSGGGTPTTDKVYDMNKLDEDF